MKLRMLLNDATANDVRLPFGNPVVCDMGQIIPVPTETGIKIMVVSNENCYLGAINIFLKEVQDEVSRELDTTEFLVIPSSKHEVLCIRPEFAKSELVALITEINATQVMEEDRLDPVPYICNVVRHTLREM
jgi:hypothetical protein